MILLHELDDLCGDGVAAVRVTGGRVEDEPELICGNVLFDQGWLRL